VAGRRRGCGNTQYIERMGTGTRDMIRKCREAGLPEPEFKLTDGFVATIWRPKAVAALSDGTKRHQVGTKLALSPDHVEILRKCLNPSGILELMKLSGRADRTKFRNQVLTPLIEEGLVEMTIPDKPTSSKQQYRTTAYGRELLNALGRNAEKPADHDD
jgi:predicted HTH transcriptional regulator